MIRSAHFATLVFLDGLSAGRDSHALSKSERVAANAGVAHFGSMSAMAKMMDPMAQAPAGKEQNQVGRGSLAE